MKKIIDRIICTLLSVLFIFSMFAGCSNDVAVSVDETTTEQTTRAVDTNNNVSSVETVTISDEVQKIAADTKNAVASKQDIATDELAPVPDNEADIVDEGAIEPDAQVEQENPSYDGTNTGKGNKLLGACSGLTYYSQADSRWANKPYTSIGDSSQTMKSSACGPTSAAMVVSSSKGAILPTTMAQLFVDNGYRTSNNGTAWACWSFVADYFDFNEYYSTSSFNTMIKYLKTDKNKDGIADYFVVASCNSGLFTTGGHYIVLVADNGGTITVYDPYLYSGKFNTASRRAAGVTVSGNSAFVSESSFKKYGNTVNYWIYSNDYKATSKSSGNTSSKPKATSYTRYVATQSLNLNVRKSASSSAAIVGTLAKGAKVTVIATSGGWSKIGTNRWVSTSYLSASPVTSAKLPTYTKGKVYTLKGVRGIYANHNASVRKKVKELTTDGKKNATSKIRNANAYFKSGTKITVLDRYTDTKQKKVWIKCPSGWITAYNDNTNWLK